MTTRDMIFVLMNGVRFNIIELTLIAIIGIVHFNDGLVTSLFLWFAFAAAAVWTVLASTRDAQDEAYELVMSREVNITDFSIGVVLLLLLSYMTSRYGLQFSAIFFVAAIQNLRYSVLAYDWLQEEVSRDPRNKRSKMPRM